MFDHFQRKFTMVISIIVSMCFVASCSKTGAIQDASDNNQMQKIIPCRATFNKIRIGMEKSQVEMLVGGPPGNYVDSKKGVTTPPSGVEWHDYAHWIAEDGDLAIHYNGNDQVDDLFIGDVIISEK